jgi:hypothetical protein
MADFSFTVFRDSVHCIKVSL